MFFKMLKNDLKAHKGLNIILFIFIICSSIISVIAVNLMYAEISGRKTTDEVSRVANIRSVWAALMKRERHWTNICSPAT